MYSLTWTARVTPKWIFLNNNDFTSSGVIDYVRSYKILYRVTHSHQTWTVYIHWLSAFETYVFILKAVRQRLWRHSYIHSCISENAGGLKVFFKSKPCIYFRNQQSFDKVKKVFKKVFHLTHESLESLDLEHIKHRTSFQTKWVCHSQRNKIPMTFFFRQDGSVTAG